MLKEVTKKYKIVSSNKSDQNYIVLYRKTDTDPWNIDNQTYFPREKATQVKNTYKEKGFNEAKVAFALIEDDHFT